MSIELRPEVALQLKASIKRYFSEQLDQEIGDLKAALLLEYVLKEIGPTIYNQAIADAQGYFQERVADLEAMCHQKEFTYWLPSETTRRGGRR